MKTLLHKLKKLFTRRPPVATAIFAVTFVVFTVYALSLLYPFYWGFLSSLKSPREYLDSPFALPEVWRFGNYARAFRELSVNEVSFFAMIGNSLWYSVGGTVISMYVISITAYVICKYEFRGKNFLYGLAVFLMIIPIMGSLPATYALFSKYRMINSPLILLASTGCFGFNFIVLYGFYKNLSWSYAEAAFIDGAGHYTVYFKIMLPMAVSPLLSLGLVSFIGSWNDYLSPMLYLDKMPTLAAGLYTFKQISAERYGNYPMYFAGVLLSMLPILVIFTIFHKTMMEYMIAGGLKG